MKLTNLLLAGILLALGFIAWQQVEGPQAKLAHQQLVILEANIATERELAAIRAEGELARVRAEIAAEKRASGGGSSGNSYSSSRRDAGR